MHPGTKTPIKVYRIADIAIDRWLVRLPSGEVIRIDPEEPMPEGADFLWSIYAKTRDASVLQFVDGVKPETYYVRTLTMQEARDAQLCRSDAERRFFAFRSGVGRASSASMSAFDRCSKGACTRKMSPRVGTGGGAAPTEKNLRVESSAGPTP